MWGNNSYGQVGPVKAATSWGSEDDEDVVVPYHMTDLARFEVDKLACGAFHNMALTSDGQLWTWGAGALGRGDEVYDSFPFPVHYFDDIQRTVTDIHASGDYSVAVTRATATSDDPSTVTEAETAGPHEVYIWGYMPTSSLRPEAKATSPALVKSLVGSRIHRLHCAPHFFSVLHSQPDEPRRPFLSVFGALKPPPTPSSSPEHVGAVSEGSDHQHELAAYPTYLDHLPDARGVYDTEPALVRHLADLPFEVTDVRRMAGTWGMQVFTLYDGRVFIMDYETLRYRPLVRDPTQDIEACGSGGVPRYRDVAVGACQVTVLDEQGRLFAWQDLDDPQRLVDKVRKEPATLLGQDSGWRRLAAQTDQFIVY
ncbi:hypothetical protein IWQ60_009236 [Tieghemiomyces parasiticus]|uniref:Uncharacterized protein n=1 Tax=Tieghemiomyces parasiticus TaxID=78921 RepID=A0A9W8DLG7_9FUNG|nr:hypothetical protein IWQ60_009236 [Tieghemiomyces parasiticus]